MGVGIDSRECIPNLKGGRVDDPRRVLPITGCPLEKLKSCTHARRWVPSVVWVTWCQFRDAREAEPEIENARYSLRG
jgi:hypothetical protein